MLTKVIGRLANYDGGTIPNTELEVIEDDVTEKGGKRKPRQKVSNLTALTSSTNTLLLNMYTIHVCNT